MMKIVLFTLLIAAVFAAASAAPAPEAKPSLHAPIKMMKIVLFTLLVAAVFAAASAAPAPEAKPSTIKGRTFLEKSISSVLQSNLYTLLSK
ncbi:hypothetical protein Bhyg_06089, partial [Pseudolycoriella hygida]